VEIDIPWHCSSLYLAANALSQNSSTMVELSSPKATGFVTTVYRVSMRRVKSVHTLQMMHYAVS